MSRRAPRSRYVPWITRALTSAVAVLALVVALIPVGTAAASASAPVITSAAFVAPEGDDDAAMAEPDASDDADPTDDTTAADDAETPSADAAEDADAAEPGEPGDAQEGAEAPGDDQAQDEAEAQDDAEAFTEAEAFSLAGFRPGNIISDAVFTDDSTMTEAQIQAFFNSKVKTCRGGSDSYGPIVCLKDFRITSVDRPADKYCDGYKGAANESAARIIHRVSIACDINPRVLIVMLQKEQSLVTHTWPSAWRYDKALGQGCPDGGVPCNPAFVGFFHQIYGAGRQMQMYMEGKYFTWYAPGKTWNILYHPNRSCGTSPVHIENKATSALYYYTPYQPNRAALQAGYGSGDSCSSYGNRNFYNYFTDWFGSTHAGGTPADVCAVPGTVKSASRQYVTTTGLNARKAPTTACGTDVFTLAKGTIVQARKVTADGDWIEVVTRNGARWVSAEHLRYADARESECVEPSGTSALSQRYVVRSSTAAKIAPWAACDLRSSTLRAGTVVEATRVSHTGNWVQVRTAVGPRWVASSAVAVAGSGDVAAACAAPAGTSGTAHRYVMRSAADAWPSPLTTCVVDERAIGVGTVVQGTKVSYSGKWLQVQTGVGPRWVSMDAVAVCADPAATKPSGDRLVVRSSAKALVSPLAECGTAAAHWGTGTAPLQLSVGTTLQATRVSYSGKWTEIRTSSGLRWIPTDAVEKAAPSDPATACAAPAGTSAASGDYVVRTSTRAHVSPLSTCADGEQLLAGSVVEATRLSYSGKWLQVRTHDGLRWVDRTAVAAARSADVAAACAAPAGTSGTADRYVVRSDVSAWPSPLTKCVVDDRAIGVGTVVQATRVSYSGKWLQVQTGVGPRWLAIDAVEVCADPAGTKRTDDRVVVRSSARALVSPLAECGTAAAHWGSGTAPLRLDAGTVLQATRVSYSGKWTEVRTTSGLRWIPSDAVETCVGAWC